MKDFVKCSIADCRHAAIQEFRVRVPATGHAITDDSCISIHLGLGVCKEHKPQVTVAEFLSPQARDMITRHMPGLPPPDYDRAFLEWMTLH